MLVLTRKMQERIQIGDNITITILRLKGRQVQVGIEAPRDVRVMRAEIPLHESEPASSQPATSMQAQPAGGSVTAESLPVADSETEEPRHATQAGRPRSVAVGRRFRIVTPTPGSKRHAAEAVAIG